jgi:aspartate carbamoyltransferase catalytic subunit
LREFTTTFGLTIERARRLRPETIIMHPGPINRGVEIDSRVADMPAAVINRQVTNGVPIRMAVLYLSVAGSMGA